LKQATLLDFLTDSHIGKIAFDIARSFQEFIRWRWATTAYFSGHSGPI